MSAKNDNLVSARGAARVSTVQAADHAAIGEIVMPFGKYHGEKLYNIPLRYLDQTIAVMPPIWLVRQTIRYVDLTMRHPLADNFPSEKSASDIGREWSELQENAEPQPTVESGPAR